GSVEIISVHRYGPTTFYLPVHTGVSTFCRFRYHGDTHSAYRLVLRFDLYWAVRTGAIGYRYADRSLPGGTVEISVSLHGNVATPRLPARG
ncbi:hypothetical protein BHE74_00055580, partial [Ensete ventricosum]